jgi:glycosyltransferase involved in cell wall biosynthesis
MAQIVADMDSVEGRMKFSIVIPALNEEQAIAGTLAQAIAARDHIIASGVDDVEIILVSDGSTDRTVEIARGFEPQVRVEVLKQNRGYGAAIKHGFDVATGDLLGFMDADGTCDPRQFAAQVRHLLGEGADICCGSRMGPDSEMPRIRRIGNHLFRAIVNRLSDHRLTDVASGMRVLRRSCLDALYPMPDGLHFTPAMSCRAALDPALKIVEVPMPYSERVGRSKLSVIGEIGLTYRPIRFLGVPGVLLCLLAIVYTIGFIVNYIHVGYVNDWLIYRLAGITAFAAAGVSLLLTGVLAERMVALLNGRERHHGGPTRLLQRVARPSVALTSAVVLLVDDDQFQIRHGSKERGAGADHQRNPSAPDFAPLVVADAFRNAAVDNGDFIGVEASGDPGDELRGKRNFRDQINRPAACREDMLDRTQVHFRFAAAGDAVQKGAVKLSFVRKAADVA